MTNKPLNYSTMTWTEFADYTKKTPYALLPIGSEEQHGHHLPMSTDSIMAQYYAEEISKRTGIMVLPKLSYSVLFSLRRFPGTLYLENDTFVQTLLDLAYALESHGIQYVYLVLGHHGAAGACSLAERQLIINEADIRFVVLALPGIKDTIKEVCTSKRWHGDLFHAEEIETSIMLAVFPELVNMEKAVCEYPEKNPLMGSMSEYWDIRGKSGVFGDATAATAEKGKKLAEAIIANSVNMIETHQNMIKNEK